MTKTRRNHKDTMFRLIFKEKENLLSLYNAVNKTHYTNVEELEINTLENAIYMNMKNDISFVFDCQLYLYEHQSTVNPNMPLRDLFYVSKVLQDVTKDEDLYSSMQKRIPTPRFIVFYNGIKEMPEKWTLSLSEAFEQPTDTPELELTVTVLNINQGNNQELMDACKVLKDYAAYVRMVRTYSAALLLEEAVERAIEECIRKGILADFLKKNRAEAMEVSLYEYNEEQHLKEERDIAKEEGIQIGQKRGEEIGQKRGEKIGEERISALNRLLAEKGRIQDILDAAKNPEYREKLLKEFEL